MRLQQNAAAFRLERAGIDAGWPHGIGITLEFLPALAVFVIADDQVAGNKEHLFPILVHERRGRINARREAQQPRAVGAFAFLVERAGDDFLLNAVGIARWCLPAFAQVERMKFLVAFIEAHLFSPIPDRAALSRYSGA